MVKIHKEGNRILLLCFLILLAVNQGIRYVFPGHEVFHLILTAVSVMALLGAVMFFRNPHRRILNDDGTIIAPADGKVVVIEETEENEYFNDKRLLVSIFMSIKNVHVNRHPISGEVKYFKYHPGKYLVAWHPKSSQDNERTTIVVGHQYYEDIEVMIRQIAGKVARRIVSYLDEGDQVSQGSELGFIKFGSRIDLYLPPGTELNIALNDKVKGGQTILGWLVR